MATNYNVRMHRLWNDAEAVLAAMNVENIEAMHGIAVRIPVFDVTPAERVTALVTESGVVFAPDGAKMRALIVRSMRAKLPARR